MEAKEKEFVLYCQGISTEELGRMHETLSNLKKVYLMGDSSENLVETYEKSRNIVTKELNRRAENLIPKVAYAEFNY